MSTDSQSILPLEEKEDEEQEKQFPESGVCDSPSQLARDYPDFKGRVKFHCIKREDEPASGGWRWHKWGNYYGKHDINVEYLYEADGRKLGWSDDGECAPLIDEQWYFTTRDKIDVLGWDEDTYEMGSPGPGEATFIRRERGESLLSALGFGYGFF